MANTVARRPSLSSCLGWVAATCVAVGGAFTLSAGCGSSGEVVFGVKVAKDLAIDAMEAEVFVDGGSTGKTSYGPAEVRAPIEIDAADLEDQAEVRVVLVGTNAGTEAIRSSASTKAISGRKILYELHLEKDCAGVSCGEGETCSEGACVSDFADPSALPDYYSKWAGGGGGGVCEPGGDPEVILGSGQSDFHEVKDGDVLQVEAGPQGGFHVWIAARMKNLAQSGSITDLAGQFTDVDYAPPPMSVIFTFDPDEGDYCKIYGLRFRLDDPDHPIESLLGEGIDLTLTITDPTGATESATRSVTLSDDILQ